MTLAQLFSCEFFEFLRTPFLQNTSGRLLLQNPVPGNLKCILRSSRPEEFCKKRVLKNFAKFTGKYL